MNVTVSHRTTARVKHPLVQTLMEDLGVIVRLDMSTVVYLVVLVSTI